MLGKSCSRLCVGGGGVGEGELVQALRSSGQGKTDMEMERPWVVVMVCCSGRDGLTPLEGELMGEKTSVSCRASELQKPESGPGSPQVKE